MNTLHTLCTLPVFALLLASPGSAQLCALHGRVVDAETGEAMELVNVFLSNTTSGSSTDAHGLFVLTGIPPGDYDFVASRVGYTRATKQISLSPDSNPEFTFLLKRKELQTEEMEVVGPDPAEWKRLLGQFTLAFLGQTQNAAQCRILNPYHLNLRFEEDRQTLVAQCDTELVVENLALGYRIAIEIEEFEWDVKNEVIRYSLYPRFEELPRTRDDSVLQEKNRKETYRGSFKHFLSSLVTGVMAEEMYAVYSGSFDELSRGNGLFLSAEDLGVVPDASPGVFQLSFGGWIRIDYRGRIPGTRSMLALLAPYVRIDREGNVLTRFGTQTGGAWSLSRIADMLPMY